MDDIDVALLASNQIAGHQNSILGIDNPDENNDFLLDFNKFMDDSENPKSKKKYKNRSPAQKATFQVVLEETQEMTPPKSSEANTNINKNKDNLMEALIKSVDNDKSDDTLRNSINKFVKKLNGENENPKAELMKAASAAVKSKASTLLDIAKKLADSVPNSDGFSNDDWQHFVDLAEVAQVAAAAVASVTQKKWERIEAMGHAWASATHRISDEGMQALKDSVNTECKSCRDNNLPGVHLVQHEGPLGVEIGSRVRQKVSAKPPIDITPMEAVSSGCEAFSVSRPGDGIGPEKDALCIHMIAPMEFRAKQKLVEEFSQEIEAKIIIHLYYLDGSEASAWNTVTLISGLAFGKNVVIDHVSIHSVSPSDHLVDLILDMYSPDEDRLNRYIIDPPQWLAKK